MQKRFFIRLFSVAFAITVVALMVHPGAAVQRPGPSATLPLPERALLDQYCVTCHNDRAKTGGLTLASLDLADPTLNADVWEKAIRKVRGGLMPPVGMPRPEKSALIGFASYLETALDRAAAAHPRPGRTVLH